MERKYLVQAAAAVAAAILSTALAAAQTTQAQAAPDSSASSGQSAKPSPYQGVSTPPDDPILTSEEPPAQPKPPLARPAAAPVVNTAHAADPDAGLVVTSALPDDSSDADADSDSTTPELKRRAAEATDQADANPDYGIVTSVPGPANALPEGTFFRVRMLEDVDASTAVAGSLFRATLAQDLLYKGRIVVPYGSELRGRIVYTTYGRRIAGRSVIHLRADEFVLPDGTHYPLHAEVIDTRFSDTKVVGEGNIAAKDHPKVLLAETAVAGGGGAVAGAALGGPAGAAVGSAVGAGFMGTHWLLADHSAYVPANSTVVFSLTDPMFLTSAHK